MEDFEYLLGEGLGVFPDLVLGESDPAFTSLRGIADSRCKIPYQEDGGMPHVLEMLELANRHHMSKVDVGRGGIHSQLNSQLLPAFQAEP